MPQTTLSPPAQSVGQGRQVVYQQTMFSAVTTNSTSKVFTADGDNGGVYLFISNGAGTCTLTVQGNPYDPTFATSQDTMTLPVQVLWDSGSGGHLTRSLQSGALSIAANTSYYILIQDPCPNIQLSITSASNLAGLTAYGFAYPN